MLISWLWVIKVELNPLWHQKKLIEFCKAKKIHITAYSPLGANGTKWGDNRIVESDVLEKIAKARGKTTAQVNFYNLISVFNKRHFSVIFKILWVQIELFLN